MLDFQKGIVFLIDKPLEWTSFDVVNKLRYALLRALHKQNADVPGVKRKIKVGHAGTLDPLATGLLIVCAGPETKKIDQYMATEKEYTGTFYLGATTPSYDRETGTDASFDMSSVTEEQIRAACSHFTGEQMQVPPAFSAIKKDGKKLYEAARQGKAIEADARPIHIMEFEITRIALPLLDFRVVCSKGTYIRSLAYDFGRFLGGGAYLHALRRTRSGDFRIEDALSIETCLEQIG